MDYFLLLVSFSGTMRKAFDLFNKFRKYFDIWTNLATIVTE